MVIVGAIVWTRIYTQSTQSVCVLYLRCVYFYDIPHGVQLALVTGCYLEMSGSLKLHE